MILYEFDFKSEVKAVNPLVKKALGEIKNRLPMISLEEEGDLCLIMSELLYNAVIHGNKQDVDKTVKLRIGIDKSSVRCVISDEGSGFDYASFLDRFKSIENIILESDHGRGVLLAVSLSDELKFNLIGNEVTFIKNISSGS